MILIHYLLSRNIINEMRAVGVVAAVMRHLSDLKEVLEEIIHATIRGIGTLFDQLINI